MTILYTVIKLIYFFQHEDFSLISVEDNSEKIGVIEYIGNEQLQK